MPCGTSAASLHPYRPGLGRRHLSPAAPPRLHPKDDQHSRADHALERALGEASAGTAQRLAESDDLRAALKWTAAAWVASMIQPEVLALRRLVTSEVRRFPELGTAWREHGPDRARPTLAAPSSV
ncbi:hypothetical protein EV651_110311 [Kribbella sp. VKM Ac-2571]|uniref:TetR/AcrR family transcriptional regulator C-terminal domain-containing protein n=1 Tax=Kribbella sp. VKM Ac-2571 TaxID=2512222 RepID=UPI00105FC250|nr:TetR/AcrR family transcriptional regulator C-terminal domain-containing protein [Kribbella sp. VKM Ac-2571]TDO58275.1 hypothetical protein EV651_110311 [Kribbella sp. VKM Ac-2571]